jgi:hypothetical protein
MEFVNNYYPALMLHDDLLQEIPKETAENNNPIHLK